MVEYLQETQQAVVEYLQEAQQPTRQLDQQERVLHHCGVGFGFERTWDR